jgi:hypothetical protein
VPEYLLTVDVLTEPVLGIPVATLNVCLTNPSPDAATVDLTVSDTQIAGLDLNQFTLGTLFNCQIVLLTGVLDGTVTVTASTNGVDVTSQPITFEFPTATATSVPATATATSAPTWLLTTEVTQLPILGVTPALVQVCLTNPTSTLVNVNLELSNTHCQPESEPNHAEQSAQLPGADRDRPSRRYREPDRFN